MGRDLSVLKGIEEKLRPILEVARQRIYERTEQGKACQYYNGNHKLKSLSCGCGKVMILVAQLFIVTGT